LLLWAKLRGSYPIKSETPLTGMREEPPGWLWSMHLEWRVTCPRREAQTKTSNSLIWKRFKEYFTSQYFTLATSYAPKRVTCWCGA